MNWIGQKGPLQFIGFARYYITPDYDSIWFLEAFIFRLGFAIFQLPRRTPDDALTTSPVWRYPPSLSLISCAFPAHQLTSRITPLSHLHHLSTPILLSGSMESIFVKKTSTYMWMQLSIFSSLNSYFLLLRHCCSSLFLCSWWCFFNMQRRKRDISTT